MLKAHFVFAVLGRASAVGIPASGERYIFPSTHTIAKASALVMVTNSHAPGFCLSMNPLANNTQHLEFEISIN